MMLYILRHATAEEAASGGDDGARKLTERSKEKMRGAAAGMRAMGLKFETILTSPLARATETAELVASAYDNSPPPQVLPALAKQHLDLQRAPGVGADQNLGSRGDNMKNCLAEERRDRHALSFRLGQ